MSHTLVENDKNPQTPISCPYDWLNCYVYFHIYHSMFADMTTETRPQNILFISLIETRSQNILLIFHDLDMNQNILLSHTHKWGKAVFKQYLNMYLFLNSKFSEMF